jgi:hypothetical protein
MKAEHEPLAAFWPYLRVKVMIYWILTVVEMLIVTSQWYLASTPTTVFGVLTCGFYAGVMISTYALFKLRKSPYTIPPFVCILLTLLLNIAVILYLLITALSYTALVTLISVGVQILGIYLMLVLRRKLIASEAESSGDIPVDICIEAPVANQEMAVATTATATATATSATCSTSHRRIGGEEDRT